jgi:hypothetical protein
MLKILLGLGVLCGGCAAEDSSGPGPDPNELDCRGEPLGDVVPLVDTGCHDSETLVSGVQSIVPITVGPYTLGSVGVCMHLDNSGFDVPSLFFAGSQALPGDASGFHVELRAIADDRLLGESVDETSNGITFANLRVDVPADTILDAKMIISATELTCRTELVIDLQPTQ